MQARTVFTCVGVEVSGDTLDALRRPGRGLNKEFALLALEQETRSIEPV